MNSEQGLSLLRSALQCLGMYLVSKGLISSGDEASLVTGLLTICGGILVVWPTIWALVTRSHTNLIKTVNTSVPGVKVVAATASSASVSAPIYKGGV